MRGGLERWKRGVGSQGVRQALAYAFNGSCDSHVRGSGGVEALAGYSGAGVVRFTVEAGTIVADALDGDALRRWVDGRDPRTDERRGRDLSLPTADLVLDGTINAPKSYSIAALINPDLAREFEELQDRLRDRVMLTWQRELNARRGAAGRFRQALQRVEVVELRHRRSRALDPHIHRHLWLNVKVLGEDGRWSNVDSRVAMKLHTVINAEGELAARTDPAWAAALARHGFTLDGDGEITELAHAVRPLSRRSNQIERNRAMFLARWEHTHPHEDPTPEVLHQIDRLAWATGRPNKPGNLDEDAWEELVRHELIAIDPELIETRLPVPLRGAGAVDADLLAARAIVDADSRATSTGGRFSRYDIRAGAARALAASGVIEDREALQPILDEILTRALASTVDLLPDEGQRPDHVKAFMAASTVACKVDLAARFDALTRPGMPASADEITEISERVTADGVVLDEQQIDAAAAIAGSDRLVAVVGPAGTGKTTMLRVAMSALARQGRRMVVVAPTKKAASVAGREIGTAAASLHALLADHGWRWSKGAAGAESWTQLRPGDVDPDTGVVFDGPRRFILDNYDRIVVDEAGMVDLHVARALACVAQDTGASIAMVGDHLQAMPVGHSGAMASLTRRSTAVIELTAVHRFHDPDYATLTLKMREPGSKDAALEVAAGLDERGLIHRVSDDTEASAVMVEAYFRWARTHLRIALVTSTNEEADNVNEAIQQRRIDRGELFLDRIAIGQGEQRILERDIVQTRRNDSLAGVDNRALWTVRRISTAGVELVSLSDPGDLRTVSHDYTAQHLHLAYASTVHGIQGETTDASIVGPGVDAAGLYVGMTRGRAHNEAIAIATTDAAAREKIADSMLRGTPEVTIDDSRRAARTELGRAARTPVDPSRPAPPAWNDRHHRPHRQITDLDRTIDLHRQREDDSTRLLQRGHEWLRATARTILALDARRATQEATAHARSLAHAIPDGEGQSEQHLRESYLTRSREHRDAAEALSRQTRHLDELEAERSIRGRLSADARVAEERGRRSAAQQAAMSSATSTTVALNR